MYGATFISTGKEQLYKLESMHMVTIAHLRTNFRAPRKYMWRHKLNYDVIMASLVRHSFCKGGLSRFCVKILLKKNPWLECLWQKIRGEINSFVMIAFSLLELFASRSPRPNAATKLELGLEVSSAQQLNLPVLALIFDLKNMFHTFFYD